MQKYNQDQECYCKPGSGGKVKGLTEIGAMQIPPKRLRQVTKYYVGQDRGIFSSNDSFDFSDFT